MNQPIYYSVKIYIKMNQERNETLIVSEMLMDALKEKLYPVAAHIMKQNIDKPHLLRIMLVYTKAFKGHPIIGPVRVEVLERLEQIRGKKII